VPVLFGGPAAAWHEEAGKRLAGLVDEGDVVIVSTDLSHYLPDAVAHQVDKRTLDTVLNKDCAALCEALARGSCSMCGGAAVVAAMALAHARGAEAWSLLDYQTSAATSGDYDRVVGYAALSMERAS
jgi:AmmeMemoRadiSam system protein B